MWLICISETSDLIQSSTVHWESAYMCTKSFLHEKIMSYFSSFLCECASPTYHYVKWNYEYGCWYSMAMSLNIQCPMVKWFCLMMAFLIWIACLLLLYISNVKRCICLMISFASEEFVCKIYFIYSNDSIMQKFMESRRKHSVY